MDKITTVSTGTPNWSCVPVPGLQVNSIALSDDGSRCICGTSNEYDSGQFGVYCFNADGSQAWMAPVGPAGSYQGVFWVGISANGLYAGAKADYKDEKSRIYRHVLRDGDYIL
ncbi:MAG: hypothetical protein Q7S67_02675, partial [Telluria sp.]|nr:hypothetical protein [Telluria sp.]